MSLFLPYLYMLGASLCFAVMSVTGHTIAGSLPWVTLSLIRILPTFFIILFITIIRKEKIIVLESIPLWFRSIFGTIALLCTFYSLSEIPATDTVTIFATTPIWISLILRIIFSKRIPFILWFFIGTTFLGIYIMERPQFSGGWVPILVAFLGAFTAASAMVNLSFCKEITPLTVVSHYSFVATVSIIMLHISLCLPIKDLYGTWAQNWRQLLIVGLSGTMGQVLLTLAYGKGKPQWISITGLSQIAFTTILELLLTNLNASINLILGLILVILSISSQIILTPNKLKTPEL